MWYYTDSPAGEAVNLSNFDGVRLNGINGKHWIEAFRMTGGLDDEGMENEVAVKLFPVQDEDEGWVKLEELITRLGLVFPIPVPAQELLAQTRVGTDSASKAVSHSGVTPEKAIGWLYRSGVLEGTALDFIDLQAREGCPFARLLQSCFPTKSS